MQVSISANGAPNHVNNAVASQIKSLRKENQGSDALLVTLRDYLASEVIKAGAVDGDGVKVTVSLTVAVEVTKGTEAKAAESARAAKTALIEETAPAAG